MALVRRAYLLLTATVLMAIMPALSEGVKIDPYMYRSVVGRITLSYENDRERQDNIKYNTSVFEQTYSLDFKGNLLSRNFMIYDAGIAYERRDFNQNDNPSDSNNIDYNISTTFLPNSLIPLTLYGKRNTSDIEVSGSKTTTTLNTYGVRWNGNFLTLPKTKISFERGTQETDGFDSSTNDFRLNLSKKWWRTYNELSYTYTDVTSETSDTQNTTSLNLINSTDISRYTHTRLVATRNTQKLGSGEFRAYGLDMGVSSAPSSSFKHSYFYNYSDVTLEDTKSRAHSFGSSAVYHVSERTNTNLSVSLTDGKSESETSTSDTSSVRASGGATHKLTEHLSLRENMSFIQEKSTTSSADEINLSDLTTVNGQVSTAYNRDMEWFFLSGSYGIGYRQDNSSVSGRGAGIIQDVYLGIGRINPADIFVLNLSGRVSRSKQLIGDFYENSYSYSASVKNTVWKKYADIDLTYKKDSTKSWLSTLSQKEEYVSLRITSRYYKTVNLTASATHRRTFNEETGYIRTDSVDASAGHSRAFYGGILRLSGLLSASSSKFEGGENRTMTATTNVVYRRPLLRRFFWQFNFNNSYSKSNEVFTNASTIQDVFFYRLRAWDLSFEHDYITTDSTDRETRENRILFRASRVFFRIF